MINEVAVTVTVWFWVLWEVRQHQIRVCSRKREEGGERAATGTRLLCHHYVLWIWCNNSVYLNTELVIVSLIPRLHWSTGESLGMRLSLTPGLPCAVEIGRYFGTAVVHCEVWEQWRGGGWIPLVGRGRRRKKRRKKVDRSTQGRRIHYI